MSNNTQINAATNPGDTIATVDISAFAAYPTTGKLPTSVLYLSQTTSSAPTPVSTANPLPVSQQGTVSAAQSGAWTVALSGTSAVNLSQIGGAAVALGQANMAGSLPVVLASNQSAVPVSQSGTWTVSTAGTTTVSGTVTANVGTTGGLALDATLTGGAAKTVVRGGQKGTTNANADITHTASGLNHEAMDVALYDGAGNQLGTSGNPVRVDPTGTTTQPVSGTVTANQGGSWTLSLSGTSAVNVAQVNGTAADTNTGNASAGTQRVVLASNQPAVPVSQSGTWTVQQGGAPWSVSQSGTWNITVNTALPAGTAQIGHVILDASAFGTGLSTDFAAALSTTVRAVKASAGRLYNVQVQNPNSTDCWVQLFDLATANVTLGTTTPKKSLFVPALGEIALDWFMPITFATAIAAAATTTATGNTAPATGLVWNADYV